MPSVKLRRPDGPKWPKDIMWERDGLEVARDGGSTARAATAAAAAAIPAIPSLARAIRAARVRNDPKEIGLVPAVAAAALVKRRRTPRVALPVAVAVGASRQNPAAKAKVRSLGLAIALVTTSRRIRKGRRICSNHPMTAERLPIVRRANPEAVARISRDQE